MLGLIKGTDALVRYGDSSDFLRCLPRRGWLRLCEPHTKEGDTAFSYILPSPPLTAPIATWHLVAELTALLGKVSA